MLDLKNLRTLISYGSNVFDPLRRFLNGLDFGSPVPRSLGRPALMAAGAQDGGSSLGAYLPSDVVASCVGNDPDCKSDDDDEAGGNLLPDDPPAPPRPDSPFDAYPPSDVVASCVGNDPDCKSDDDDEAGGNILPDEPPSPPRPGRDRWRRRRAAE